MYRLQLHQRFRKNKILYVMKLTPNYLALFITGDPFPIAKLTIVNLLKYICF